MNVALSVGGRRKLRVANIIVPLHSEDICNAFSVSINFEMNEERQFL